MSDRFPQYPMFNNPALLQAQQQQQQQAQQNQQQQLQQQPDQHAAYPDQNRMWQQQMQQQFRPRSGMDITQATQQANPQMQDIFRARLNAQNTQMAQQTQPQPQFSLGMPSQQMGAAGGTNPLAANQQQPFSDPSSNHSQPSHMPAAGFPNMGPMPNQNPGLNAASLQQRNPGIIGMQNAGPMSRQLELMLQQQQQQQQQQPNGVFLNAAKLNQQPQQVQQQRDQQMPQQQLQPPGMNHPNSTDIFTSPALTNEALRRPSPSHSSNLNPQVQGAMQAAAQQHPPGMLHPNQGLNPRRTQPMSLQEISERIRVTRATLLTSEVDMRNTMAQMQVTPSQELTAKLRSLQTDIKSKQEYIARLSQQQSALQNSAIANGMPRMGPNGVPGQPGWPQQGVPSQVFDNNGNMGRGNALGQTPQQQSLHPQSSNGIQSSPSMMQTTSNLMNPANIPRSGPTPNPQGPQPPQQLGSPFSGQMNAPANMANKPPFLMNGFNMNGNPATAGMQSRPLGGIPPAYPPPVDKAKFDGALQNFLQKKGVNLDPNLLRLNDQQIDLGLLHSLIMNEGGFQKVTDNESWHVVGGRMGFVQFPGSEREPAKSGPGVAQHLAHVYREYLLDFEQFYVRSWAQRLNINLNHGLPQATMNHPGAGAVGGAFSSGPGPNTNGQPGQRITPTLLQYAHMSNAELHQRGLPDNLIALVEQHRPQLQRTLLETKRFQQQVRMNVRNAPVMAGMPADANGMQPPNQGGLMTDPALRQQLLQKQQQHQQQQRQQLMAGNMMENRLQGGLPVPNPMLIRDPGAVRMALDTVNRLKEEFKKGPQQARLLSQNIELPYEQRAEFNQLLGTAHRQCADLNEKLHILHLLLQNPTITQKAVAFCSLITTQKQLLSGGQPRFILNLETLRGMVAELHKTMEALSQQQQVLQRLQLQQQQQQAQQQQAQQQQAQQQQAQQQHQQSLIQNQPHQSSTHPAPHSHSQLPPSALSMNTNINGSVQPPPEIPPQNRSTMLHQSPAQPPALQQPPPTQQQQNTLSVQQQQPQAASPSLAVQSNRSAPITLQAPPKRKPHNAPTPSNTAPSPAAAVSASTPVPTNAPTPTATAASPSAPKSPKGKAPAKSKQQPQVKRKMSKSAPAPSHPNATNPPAPAPAPTPTSAPAPEQLQSQASTSTNGSQKRAREEDIPNVNGFAPSPAGGSMAVSDQPSPPKRVKVEWETAPSEELQQKKAIADNMKTEEDAGNFLVHMSELLKMTGGSQQEPDGLSNTLNMLLKGVTGNPDDLSALSFGPSGITPLSPAIPNNEFEKYFDFTLGGTQDGEEDDSKTPELTSSSSTTNPSPGSNSGNEPTAEGGVSGLGEIKTEEPFGDFTRLGLWKEIDGGESSFYQTSEWKWDSTMPSLDQPWAIFTS